MRKFSWFMLGILFSQAMFAQVKLGAKAGYLYSDASGDLDSHHYNGYTVGITSCIPVGSSSNIIGELLFSKRGYAVDNSVMIDGEWKNLKAAFSYIDMPVMYEYKVFPFASVLGGAYFGVQAGRSLYYSDERQDDNLMGEKQLFDCGLLVGIRLYHKNLFLEAQYQHGLTSPYKNVGAFKSRSFCVNLGYMFPL